MPLRPDRRHRETRSLLGVVGAIMLITGLIFLAIGLTSFFTAFGSHQAPRYFWCAFIGLPMTGFGVGILKFAFMGTAARYMANEMAPVGKDVVNYMAHNTRGAVREVAAAAREGFRRPARHPSAQSKHQACPQCQAANDLDARFCKSCGNALASERDCPNCSESNDADARFCDHCGHALA